MPENLKSDAWQHLQKANSQLQRGQYTAALATLAEAEQLSHKAKASDVLSAVLGTTASVLQSKGMFDDALKLHITALNIQEELAKIDSFFNTWVATTLNNLGTLLSNMGRPEDAKKRYERALKIYEALIETDTENSVYQSWVAGTLNNLGALLSDMGRQKDAKIKYERAFEIYEALLETDTGSSVCQSWVAGTLNNLGALLSDMGRQEDAKTKYERALQMREALLETDPQSSVYQSDVSMTLNNLGNLLKNMGRPEDAKTKYERALQMREALLETAPQSSVYQSDVSMTLNNLGNLLSDMGRQEDAKTKYERALQMREVLLETDTESSVHQSWVATTLNNLGALLFDMGRQEDAKTKYERALQLREALLETDTESSVYQSWVATTLNNLGALLSDMGRQEDAKTKHERALQMREILLETDTESSVYQSWVATTLNNLGNLRSNMGRQEDAKTKYERALEIYEALLETDTGSSVYQSWVAGTLNNLGALLKNMGRQREALGCYHKSLDIYTEPMQYMTIKAKARAIINIVQLVSGCAQEDTNIIHKSKYFDKLYEIYKEHSPFFAKYELAYEGKLIKEAGLSAHIQYLMLNARSEEDKEKRIEEYETCIVEVKQIVEAEDDENLKELWTSIMYYLKGRQFVNKAMRSEHPGAELMEKAIEQFKLAKDRYSQANVCYCIYTVLLELESIEVLDDENVSNMKKQLKSATKSLPEKMDDTVKTAFHEIEELLDNRNLKTDPEMFERLNKCITKIDYYALREHFNHISCKIRAYLKEPFSPEVKYNNWGLHITFDEPEKVQGKLTIKAGDRDIFCEPLKKRHEIYLNHRSQTKDETITFITEKNRNVIRPITYSEKIKHDNGYLDVHFLEHDCKRGITGSKLNIAIVQLKYHLNKIGHALLIDDDDAYSAKLMQILDAVKGKADLIVFPEFSIPVNYLPEMKQYSDENGTVIVAGSHYITDETLSEYDGMFYDEFDDNDDLLKNISPIIIPSQEKILHTEKVLSSKEERPMFSDDGMTHGTLNRIFKLNDDVTFGAMICFDFMKDELRTRITDECNIIFVPQTNPGIKRFHHIGENEIDNPRSAGNKAFIMANGIFTYDDEKKVMGGDSGIILTLDKESKRKYGYPIIESVEVDGSKVHEQFIMLAKLNTNFFSARETQDEQIAINYKLIHIFEENEILKSSDDGKNPQAFLALLKAINSCEDKHELKKLLADNGELIRKHSPLMHKTLIQKPSNHNEEIWNEKTNPEKIEENLENLSIKKIKKKCANIVIN